MPKICPACNAEYSPRANERTDAWRKRIYCSRSCANVAQPRRQSCISDDRLLEIQKLHDDGLSLLQCASKLKVSASAIYNRVRAGKLRCNFYLDRDLEKYAGKNSVRAQILKKNLLKYECAGCGIPPLWMGKPLLLELDHINGDRFDHRLSNLRFLCMNCHSQTDTFRHRNRKLKRPSACSKMDLRRASNSQGKVFDSPHAV